VDILGDEEAPSDTTLPPEHKRMVMSHIYGLLRQSGPEGATEFKTLPVEITNTLGSAADEATRAMPDFEYAYVLSRFAGVID